MSRPFRKDGWPKDWYESDFHTSVDIEEVALSHLKDRDADLKARGAKFNTFTTTDDDGKIRVHAQQFPGPGNLIADRTRVRILVERISGEKRQMKNIDLQDLPAHENDG
jgi:hypothetical protein